MRSSLAIAIIFVFGSMVSGFSCAKLAAESVSATRNSSRLGYRLPSGLTFLQGQARFSGLQNVPDTVGIRSASVLRAGSNAGTESESKSLGRFLASLWGTGGVLYILQKAIVRVIPIALEPFRDGAMPLSQFQLGLYVATCLWFAYVEGYKGFQTKFSPLVVERSMTLVPGKSNVLHFLFAPFYSMGLFHATKKRKIVSWSVTIGVAAVVAAVKRLPYPWRNIVDAGVIAGLSWGSVSIVLIYIKAWVFGKPPSIDPALPEKKVT